MKGRLNVYTCTCGARVTTLDRDDGVTPFMITHPGCGGAMTSACYRPDPADLATPAFEWIAPAPAELVAYLATVPLRFHPHVREHVAKGGLIMRPLRTH